MCVRPGLEPHELTVRPRVVGIDPNSDTGGEVTRSVDRPESGQAASSARRQSAVTGGRRTNSPQEVSVLGHPLNAMSNGAQGWRTGRCPTPRAGQGRVLKEWVFCSRCAAKARIDYWWDHIDLRILKLLCPGRMSPPAPLFWAGSSPVTTRHTICRGTWAEVRPGFSAAIDRMACSGLSASVSRKGREPP